eukprot:3747974-Karenia_brevis.AAC.1
MRIQVLEAQLTKISETVAIFSTSVNNGVLPLCDLDRDFDNKIAKLGPQVTEVLGPMLRTHADQLRDCLRQTTE